MDTITDTILHGDALETLRMLPNECVQTCVTSPPYWGLRDYGMPGQLGLERTPDEYVARLVDVFAEVRRVLRQDGTLWLNIGDCYANDLKWGGSSGGKNYTSAAGGYQGQRQKRKSGLKAKDLVGMPWMVAFALRQPYYTGRIRDERDRMWLAAMLDAEGCIYIHKRCVGQNAGDGYVRNTDTYSVGIEIANTHLAIVQRCAEIAGAGSISRQDGNRKQPIFRWHIRTQEARQLLRELYPHLVGKQQQARIGYGCPSSGEQAEAAHQALKLLHGGSETTVDFPEPPTMFEPGWYLRSDCIWAKPNPMPESVRDRPTRAHEYVFLLAKSARYYYDAAAIAEPALNIGDTRHLRGDTRRAMHLATDFSRERTGKPQASTRNKRDVWTVATAPYSGAHFATFPPALIEPCVLAGSSPRACETCGAPWIRVIEREPTPEHIKAVFEENRKRSRDQHGRSDRHVGTHKPDYTRKVLGESWRPTCRCAHNTGAGHSLVLDPFFGAGTVGVVARRHSRHYLGIELSAAYIEMAERRIANERQPHLWTA